MLPLFTLLTIFSSSDELCSSCSFSFTFILVLWRRFFRSSYASKFLFTVCVTFHEEEQSLLTFSLYSISFAVTFKFPYPDARPGLLTTKEDHFKLILSFAECFLHLNSPFNQPSLSPNYLKKFLIPRLLFYQSWWLLHLSFSRCFYRNLNFRCVCTVFYFRINFRWYGTVLFFHSFFRMKRAAPHSWDGFEVKFILNVQHSSLILQCFLLIKCFLIKYGWRVNIRTIKWLRSTCDCTSNFDCTGASIITYASNQNLITKNWLLNCVFLIRINSSCIYPMN